MTVIADFSIPADQFVLSHACINVSGIDIEIKRIVAHIDEDITPYFYVSGDGLDAVGQVLTDDPTVTDVTLLQDFGDERFYRAQWVGDLEGFMPGLQRADAGIQSATY